MESSMFSDEPISSPDEDVLGRAALARQIADVISAYEETSSLVVGVYGTWGSGKTSLLRMIDTELQEDISSLWFNPWMFTDVTNLVTDFFSSIGREFDKDLSKKERIGGWLATYGTAIAPDLSFFGIGLSAGKAIEAIGKVMKVSSLEEARDKINKRFHDEKKRIVVFIDDIDRLDKNEIRLILKMVKLTAQFDYLVYVLAFDDLLVASALNDPFPGSMGTEGGGQFIEKIVQLPIRLPPTEARILMNMCFGIVESLLSSCSIKLSEAQEYEFGTRFNEGFKIVLKTPRSVKRYGNALALALPALKNEVNPVDLMLIEAIRLFYPSVYTVVRDNKMVFTKARKRILDTDQSKEYVNNTIQSAIDGLTDSEKEAVGELLKQLFPRIAGYSGADWDRQQIEERRISTEQYFDKYFLYSVPSNQVSDEEINRLLDDAKRMATDELITEIRSVIGFRRASFIDKMNNAARNQDEETSIALIKAVTRMGMDWPNPPDFRSCPRSSVKCP